MLQNWCKSVQKRMHSKLSLRRRKMAGLESAANGAAETTSERADAFFRDATVAPHRDPLVLREQVYAQLRRVIDPDLGRDIVSLGFIKQLEIDYGGERVAFTLELTTPACPVREDFVEECKRHLMELEWVSHVEIELTAREKRAFPPNVEESAMAHLKNVSWIIAVASCKGGVGKSTIAANFAYFLQHRGARVGLCDCDIYGPSLPHLIDLENPSVYFEASAKENDTPELGYESNAPPECASEAEEGADRRKEYTRMFKAGKGGLVPLQYGGVKLMSYGFIKSAVDYAAVRGPMAASIIYQLVTQTIWGHLDYLVLDLPPGTGDVHLTLSQSVPIAGAVMVTTPHLLSVADVEKGIKMFAKVNIPTIAVVENMATFTCDTCGCESRPFAGGGEHQRASKLWQDVGVGVRIQLPLNSGLGTVRFENGLFPFARARDSTDSVWRQMDQFTADVVREVSKTLYSQSLTPNLRSLANGMLELTLPSSSPKTRPATDTLVRETVLLAPARQLRLGCRCAECVDEYSGAPRLNPRKVPLDVHPVKLKLSGNYAVHVDWSDGHASLFAFELLRFLFSDTQKQQQASVGASCLQAAGVEW